MANGGRAARRRQQGSPGLQPQKIFDFQFSGEEVDQIIASLMERPMKEVFQVFIGLQNQLREQMNPQPIPKGAQGPAAEKGNGVDQGAAGKEGDKECRPSQRRPSSSGATR